MDVGRIETHRLLIRRFVPEDWEGVIAFTADPEVTTYIPDAPQAPEQAQRFVAGNASGDARAVALVLKGENQLIGHLPFHPWHAPRTYEIGWVLHRRYHGYGYATEAAVALLRYGFETLGLHRMIATCQPENVASWRVMEKLGMRRRPTSGSASPAAGRHGGTSISTPYSRTNGSMPTQRRPPRR